MEEQNSPHGQIIEIRGDVSYGGTSTKFCGEARCGIFSDQAGSKSKDAKDRSDSMRKLLVAVALCLVFMSVEVVGGIKANSLAILTDAAHLLSDIAAFAISLLSLWATSWDATPRESYGFFRVEILGTLISIQLIWLLAGIIVYEAIYRLVNETGEVNGFLMFGVAAFGLVVNIIMALFLGHDHGHGGEDDHGFGHSHGPKVSSHHHHQEEHSRDELDHAHRDQDHLERSDCEGHDHVEPLLDKPKGEINNKPKPRNINVQGAYLHVLGDSIQSIGVMIGGGIIWYKPQWKIIDLICTLIFSVIVLGTTIKMLRSILGVLMESTPREINASELEHGLLKLEEVVAIHELHIWAITVGKVLLACHVKIRPEANADIVLDKVIDYIRNEYNITHVTIQIEH